MLVLGTRSWIPLDHGLEHALRVARGEGAAVTAAHPHGRVPDPKEVRTTRWFWRNRDRIGDLVDRWEIINRGQTFGWIAELELPPIASGDFHRREHLETWKTSVPCRKTERDFVAHLRSDRPTYIVPWHRRAAREFPQAA